MARLCCWGVMPLLKQAQDAGIASSRRWRGGHTQGWCAGDKEVHCQELQSMDAGWVLKVPPGTVPDLSKRQDPTKMRNTQIFFPLFPLGSKRSDHEQTFLKWKMRKLHITIFLFFLKPHHNWPQLMFFRSHPSSLIMFCLLSTELSPATSHLTYWSQAMKKDLAKATWNIQPHNTQTNILTLHMLRLTIHLSLFSLFPIDLLDW